MSKLLSSVYNGYLHIYLLYGSFLADSINRDGQIYCRAILLTVLSLLSGIDKRKTSTHNLSSEEGAKRESIDRGYGLSSRAVMWNTSLLQSFITEELLYYDSFSCG